MPTAPLSSGCDWHLVLAVLFFPWVPVIEDLYNWMKWTYQPQNMPIQHPFVTKYSWHRLPLSQGISYKKSLYRQYTQWSVWATPELNLWVRPHLLNVCPWPDGNGVTTGRSANNEAARGGEIGSGRVMPVALVVAWLKMYILILQAETTVSAILSTYATQVVSSKVQQHQS